MLVRTTTALAVLLSLAGCEPDPEAEFNKHMAEAQVTIDKAKALQDENVQLERRKAELCRQIPDYAGCH
jgi:hypothetical protein